MCVCVLQTDFKYFQRKTLNIIFVSLFADSAAMSFNIDVNSPNVRYTDTHIESEYEYQTSSVHKEGNRVTVSGPF